VSCHPVFQFPDEEAMSYCHIFPYSRRRFNH